MHIKEAVPEAVTAADIARRLALSADRTRVLTRQRGFPAPIAKHRASLLWRWRDVEDWARAEGRLP
jgi:hypothetical protein